MLSWYFRRFRPVRKSKITILSPRIESLEERLNPAFNFVPGSAFTSVPGITNADLPTEKIAVGDFDGDGNQDFVVYGGNGATQIASGTNQVLAWFGNGDGTFTADNSEDDAGFLNNYWAINPNSLWVDDVASLNSGGPDGKSDFGYLFTSGPSFGISDDIDVFSYGTSTITGETGFDYSNYYSYGPTTNTPPDESVATGDFNNDGMKDFVVGHNDGTGLGIILNEGNATFGTETNIANANGLSSVVLAPIVADFNGDSNQDILAVNSTPVDGAGYASIFYGDGTGNFPTTQSLTIPEASTSTDGIDNAAVGDFNGDGKLDILLVQGNKGYVFLQGASGFSSTPSSTFTFSAAPNSIAVGDFNGDSIDDIAATSSNTADDNVHIYAGTASGTFTSGAGYEVPIAGAGGALAVINGTNDGQASLIVGEANASGDIFQYLDNQSNNTVTSVVTAVETPNPVVVGQPVTFTANVATENGVVPTGTVSFTVDGNVIGTGTLDGTGTATFVDSDPGLAVGNHSVVDNYSGDGTYPAGSGDSTLVVSNKYASTITATENPNPDVLGDPVTFTATVAEVNGVEPTGTITFTVDGTVIGTGTLDDTGTASIIYNGSPIALGSNPVVDTYTGDANYQTGTSATSTLNVVSSYPSTVTATESPNPAVTGTPVTFTATVAAVSGVIPTGTITFTLDGTAIGTATLDATGKATYLFSGTPALAIGDHTVVDTYSGDSNYAEGTSASSTLAIVSQYPGTVTVSESPNPAGYGAAVTFTAVVAEVNGTVPTGTVTFTVDGTVIGTATLDATGKATFISSGPPFTVGTHSVVATYSGDASYLPGTSAGSTLTITGLPSDVTLTYVAPIPANPPAQPDAKSVYDEDVTLTAQLALLNGIVPDGTFTFYVNGVVLGTAASDATGQGVLVTPSIPVGTGEILSVTYAGDTTYADTTAAVDATPKLDVVALPTTITVTPSSNPSVYGQPLTYTVQVNVAPPYTNSVTPNLTGTAVSLLDNNNVIAILYTNASGEATFTVVAGGSPDHDAIGSHEIQAVLPTTANITGASSTLFTQVIDQADSQTSLTAGSPTITFGQSVTLAADVSIESPGVGTPSGSVTFYEGTTALATVAVGTDGTADYSVSGLAEGSYDFTAVYSGNSSVAGSTSGDAPVTVSPTTSATTLTVAPLSSSLGTPVAVTANVVDGNGLPVTVGTVTFSGTFDGAAITPQTVNVVDGTATATFTGLPFGSGDFTAAFTGTSSIDDSTAGPADFTVTKAVPNVGLSTTVASDLPVGTSVPVLATVTPPSNVSFTITGEIEFFDNGTLFDTEPVKDGTASTTRILALGSHVITATYEGDSDYTTASTAGLAFTITRPTDDFSVGAGAGGFDSVTVYNSSGKAVFSPLYAFSPDYTGGVRVATADFNGDGIEDVVLGSGPGTGSRVRVLSGKDGSVLADFSPFGSTYTGGVFVAAGDVNGDGIPDIVVTPDEGGGARVRVYSGKDFSTLADFFALVSADGTPDLSFRGGARAAVGDINGDGYGDIVVSAGYGGGPRIAVFSGKSLTRTGTPIKLVPDFFAFESTLRNGAYVAVGDINGDGDADIVVGAGPGGGPRVSVFDGADLLKGSLVRIADFFAGDPASRTGVPVATRYLDSDNKEDLVTGSGTGGDTVTAYLGADLSPANIDPTPYLQFDAFTNHPDDADLGVYVG